jgi:hypothetical protein
MCVCVCVCVCLSRPGPEKTSVQRSLKVSDNGVAQCVIFLDFIHRLEVFKPQRFGSWFYFRLQAKGEQKLNLLGSGRANLRPWFETSSTRDPNRLGFCPSFT